MNTYWISLPCDLLSSLASFQCSLLHHLHLSSDLDLSKYVNQHSHLNLSRNVRLPVLYDLDFNSGSRESHFVGMCPCCLCKPGRQIQIIEPTIVELVFKLVEHSQNTRMQW